MVASGCTTSSVDNTPQTDEASVLRKAQDHRAIYLANRDAMVSNEYWYDLPLIGTAAGAIAALSYAKHTAQTNWVAGLGIGAGLLMAYRTYIDPSDTALAYQNAADADNCIIQATMRLFTTPQNDNMGHLSQHLIDIAIDIAKANKALANPAAAGDALKSDRDNLAQAIKAATSAQTAGQQEIQAWHSHVADVNYAIDKVDSKLFKLIQKKPVNYAEQFQTISTLLQNTSSLKSAVTQAQQGNVPTSPPKGAGAPQAQIDLENAANSLSEDTTAITSIIANAGYASMQNAVQACVAQFGA
jgi:hypothetical protein